ncbi:hypothetical protein [Aureispira sp. CCB-QB1]|uniref:hypothetical protein n=1 Tax=Aureispira sp. CCB-QB1 TaxID=1313421 RepID=UPI000696C682|nr:hypothetical protein [Aureispira sp. CCB-QB1]
MKYLIFFLLTAILLFGCDDQSDNLSNRFATLEKEQLKTYSPAQMRIMLSELQTTQRLPQWVEAVVDWIRDQFGRDQDPFESGGCSGSGGCGPCSGFCDGKNHFGGTSNGGSSTLSQADYQAGLRLYKLTLMHNQQTGEDRLLFEFPQGSDFINSNNELIIPQDIFFSPQMTQLYNRNSIQLKAGVYPLVFNSNNMGQTLVDANIN